MKDHHHIPGFFGKVASQADFVCRSLPSDFVQNWENWLQASLRTSQRVLGKAWLDLYLSSHIWRFVLQPKVCGAGAWAGVLMPSLDRGGHYFPLTFAARISASRANRRLMDQAVEWFDHLEKFALYSLEDDFDIARLDQALEKLGPLDNWRKTSFGQLLATPFTKSETGGTLWQAMRPDDQTPAVKEFQGLPTPEDYVDLMTEHSPLKSRPSPAPPNDSTQVLMHEKDREPQPEPEHSSQLWRSWGATDVGLRRRINEDAYLDHHQAGLWVVADGMGGHSAGDVASQTVVRRLSQITPQPTLAALEALAQQLLQKANTELLDLAKEMGPGHVVGTTAVAMLAVEHTCAALWAGDSRLYRHREGELVQLTEDHSMAVEMAKVPNAVPDGYGDNIVTRALGADPVLEVEAIEFDAKPGDSYLLCSDGLFKEVHPFEIEKILSQEPREKCVSALIDLALERQARDNVTLILISAEPTG